MKNKNAFSNKGNLSDFYCTCCGKKGIPIFRAGRVREPGHLKKLYCINCQKETNFVEVRPFGAYNYQEFYLEWKYGNFDVQGNRINPSYKNFISNLKRKEV